MLKQSRQLSYQELAFHLEDSASFRAFVRLPRSWSPQKSVLQKTISAVRPETWEQTNRALLSSARQAKLEDGTVVRLGSTVTSALMHEPSDSSLLWDAVRAGGDPLAISVQVLLAAWLTLLPLNSLGGNTSEVVTCSHERPHSKCVSRCICAEGPYDRQIRMN